MRDQIQRIAGLLGKRQSSGDDGGTPPAKVLRASQLAEKDGLFILNNIEDARVDIVAVHGLCGDAYETWTEGGKLWLRDFLPHQITDARIISYGYNSQVFFSKSVAVVDDFATDLVSRLNDVRKTHGSKNRPIIFICHSLGGIVVKKALTLDKKWPGTSEDPLNMTKGVVFMGTPHRGSDAAYWGGFFARALRAIHFGCSTNTSLLSLLEKDSEALPEISEAFIQRHPELRIRTFYETDTISGMGSLVVDKESACLNISNETALPISSNHLAMCKFSDINSTRYQPVLNAIKELVGCAKEDYSLKTYSAIEDEMTCLQSLYTSDYDSHKERIASRIPGTCTWFLEHQIYRSWLMKEGPGLLWVTGDPGCGKSVLSSFLVDELRRTTEQGVSPPIVCFFFCDDKIESQKDAAAILCGLLHQIFSANRPLIRHALRHFQTKPKMASNIKALWDVLNDVSTDPEAGNIICVIDALDECEESSRDKLIKWFLERLKTTKYPDPPFLKVLMTSRPYTSIEKSFHNVPNIRLKVENETGNTSADVARVIKMRLRHFKSHTGCSERSRLTIERQLTSNADRTFLWVSFVLELLDNSAEASEEALGRLMTTLPKRLDDVYDNILRKIPTDHREKARKILTILVGVRRPLTLDELNIAIGIDPSDKSIDDMSRRLEPKIEQTVKALCGSFIRVINSRVFLVHQTAKEFLLKSSGNYSLAGDIWKHCIDPIESNLLISRICIWYLLVYKPQPDRFTRQKPRGSRNKKEAGPYAACGLLDYAATNWVHHLREGKGLEDPGLVQSVIQLWDSRSRRLSIWLQVYRASNPDGIQYPMAITGLMVASHLGHEAVVRFLIDNGANIGAEDHRGNHALHWAARGGHLPVVRLLVSKGAGVKAKSKCGDMALHCAAAGGHEEVVRFLVDEGADINGENAYKGAALQFAARGGHEAVVGFLLRRKASVNTSDQNSDQAIHLAAAGGYTPVVRLLVEKGARVNGKGRSQATALHCAAKRGQWAVVQFLIGQGVEIDLEDEKGNTALYLAIVGGHDPVVRLLVNKGAKIGTNNERHMVHLIAKGGNKKILRLLVAKGFKLDAKGSYGNTPLHFAANTGNLQMLRLLAEEGATINLKDRYGCTALHRAVIHGIAEAVQLLLRNGADIEARDKDGNTPLLVAAGGHYETTTLLLENGARIDATNRDGRTVLHLAVRTNPDNHPPNAYFKTLLEWGAECIVSEQDIDGKTALHEAISRRNEVVIRLLVPVMVKNKIGLDMKDNSGQTALDWAIKGECREVEEFLRQEMGRGDLGPSQRRGK